MPQASIPSPLFDPVSLPNGTVLKNRIVKSAMSDSLGDGRGNPTPAQIRLYRLWGEGGAAAAIVGEVQGDGLFPERPGNLVLAPDAPDVLVDRFRALARAGKDLALWLQLGHAGALAHPPLSAPAGPSALDLPGLSCRALTAGEIAALPEQFARTARQAQDLGFGGVQIHAAHGFLLSQFLSPLFNRRTDRYGGPIANRMRPLLEVVAAVRAATAPDFTVALKLNATDQLTGGLEARDALTVVGALSGSGLDLIDISGGTYFPGAPSASDRTTGGAYFRDFARAARTRTDIPLMLTGGIKTRAEALDCVTSGDTDLVGLARALVLDPDLPRHWQNDSSSDPVFPRFESPPEGGVTAWYTMALTALAEDRPLPAPDNLPSVMAAYEARDADRTHLWRARFGGAGPTGA
ncbi:oxidoreductase [Chachezhania sediminis]|uniref:oxidoreductase n=1 Tax=Chachezhania sediminis TaxID=2599291 RepID=UPI00131C9C11|nr:oxidoreductase [Chachezhania sediminis]